MKLYLAGAMTGIPRFNFPAFESWMAQLELEGFDVLSPHLADPEHVQEIAWNSTNGDPAEMPEDDGPIKTALRNVEGLAQCDGVALIDGWYKSSGTQHEIATAHRFRIPVAPVGLWVSVGAQNARGALS